MNFLVVTDFYGEERDVFTNFAKFFNETNSAIVTGNCTDLSWRESCFA